MDLAHFLKIKREGAGLSQGHVAKKLKYTSPQFVSNWERGVSSPPIKILRILSDMYGISCDDLFELVVKHTLRQLKENLLSEYKMIVRKTKTARR
jgi:transcriptional regulator with XRE-family HTH domain